MRQQTVTRGFAFLFTYPLLLLMTACFAVLQYRLANRFGCFGFLRNVAYGFACAGATVTVFFLVVLIVRLTGMDARLPSQVPVAFGFAGFITLIGRFVFAQRPPATTAITNRNEENEAA